MDQGMMKKAISIFIEEGTFNQEYKGWLLQKLNEKYDVTLSDQPDYYICACFNNDYMKQDCVKIQILGENITPDFNFVDYAVGFDYMQFEDRYLRFPIYLYWKKDFEAACQKHLRTDDYFLSKRKFCNFIYSNNKWQNEIRNQMFYKFSEYKDVESGGRVLNNIGYFVPDKRMFQEDFKFSIACENSKKNGYTTEKIIQAFSAGTIPIYWGNPLIVKDFNPKAFINVFDYPDLDACLEKIKEIDQSEDLYLQMQHEPIYAEGTYTQEYLDNPNMLIDFLDSIFSQPYETAKRIYNWNNGYNSEYRKIIQKGWKITMAYKKPIRAIRKICRK